VVLRLQRICGAAPAFWFVHAGGWLAMSYLEIIERCTIVVGAMESLNTGVKMRFRVKAPTRMYAKGVPDDARPGDLIVGNRGAAALVRENTTCRVLYLDYAGNVYSGATPAPGCKLYDFR
jgi:hypothetical protein